MSANEGVRIGGEKGHIEEVVHNPIFIAFYKTYRWKMIPNCTGRYTCRDHKAVSHLTPTQLLESIDIGADNIGNLKQYYVTFGKERRKDPIYVIPFADDGLTGLITYVKHEGDNGQSIKYVHTLNSASGFQRKLDAMHVNLLDEYLVDVHLGKELETK